jgi:CCR4-NOT complex subunit CAF16
VTVDLDVLVRSDLLEFLKDDSIKRNSTILCAFVPASYALFTKTPHLSDATHIFDGLSDFPTHVIHMRFGTFVEPPVSWPPATPADTKFTQLYYVALNWLKEDREERRILEAQGQKTRGARREQVCAPMVIFNPS